MSSKLIASFIADRPDDITMDLTICMTLGEWKKVKAAIEKSGEHTHYGPLGVVCKAVSSMVGQAERAWTPERSEGSS